MQLRPERLIGDLRELASIGKFDTGVNRPAFSAADLAAREWLRDKMQSAGLDAVIDDRANVYGRMARAEHAVLIGSHSDSVSFGGWLDGSLGVIYGLEIARCVAGNGKAPIGVDVISFQDEEGTFLGMLGSRSFCGENIDSEIRQAQDEEGRALEGAISKAGLVGRIPARLELRRHLAYFEAHIEQGPRLENSGNKIGVVTAVVGIRTFRIVFRGQANHAGTTPMKLRRDAGAAALNFGASIRERLRAAGNADAVWNVGSVKFKPGAANVVPGEAEVVMQVRDASSAVLEQLEQVIRAAADDTAEHFNVGVEVTRLLAIKPAEMKPALTGLIEQAATALGASHERMPSGAGHDAMIVSRHIPAAMLFVPSIGGISHDVTENTTEEDIVLGARVLLRAVELFMREQAAA